MQKPTTIRRVTDLVENIITSLSLPDARRPPQCYLNEENPQVLAMENVGAFIKDIPQTMMDRLPDLIPYIDGFNRLVQNGDIISEPIRICLIQKDNRFLLIIEFELEQYGDYEKVFVINNADTRELLDYLVDNSVPLYENTDLIYNTPDPKPESLLPVKTDRIYLTPN